jgi:hypothetical protein
MFNIKALTDAPAKITPKGGKKKETIAQTSLYKVLILLCINLEKKLAGGYFSLKVSK